MTLVQPYTAPSTRYDHQGAAHLRPTAGRHATTVDVDMTPASLSHAGQVVTFPSRSSPRSSSRSSQTSNGTLPQYDGQSGVGLAELGIPGVKATEILRLPNGPVQGRRHRRRKQRPVDHADP